MQQTQRPFYASLEGIRAYAFLVVFVVHCSASQILGAPKRMSWLWPLNLLMQVSWIAVPIFFVLSGYLITGLLYDTRDKAGFFRVFFGRRALRILPLYYVLLGIVFAGSFLAGLPLHRPSLSFFLYVQNFVPDWRATYQFGRYLDVSPLWSLAIEEQFYLVWPLAIWLLRSRVSLLRLSYGLIAGATVLRVVWPWLPMHVYHYQFAYENTFTRGDALLMGAALALHQRGEGFQMSQLARYGRMLLMIGSAVLAWRLYQTREAQPFTYFGLAVLTPAVNLVSLGLVMLAIAPESLFGRLCSLRPAVWLGRMSYGLYLYHCLFVTYAVQIMQPSLKRYIGSSAGMLLMMLVTFAVTCTVSWLSYRYMEMPLLRFKERFRYGPAVPPPPLVVPRHEPVAAAWTAKWIA